MTKTRRRVGAVLGGTVIGAGLLLPGAGVAAAAATCATRGPTTTCTYSFTGGEQTFRVPAGVGSVQVTAIGGAGGPGETENSSGGRGARVAGTLAGLRADQVLYVEVGGAGHGDPTGNQCDPTDHCLGGFNGGGSSNDGGGGGGASDVRTSSSTTANSLASRLIVAAGGGGGGGITFSCSEGQANGGDGGNAGEAGAIGKFCGRNSPPSVGGGAGTATAGGAAGTAGYTDSDNWTHGLPGGKGVGADTSEYSGGAGGGGLWGGGSGAEPLPDTVTQGETVMGAGGGGGGSSLVPAGGTVRLASGPAAVTISYTSRSEPPPVATAASVRGAGTFTAGGQRYSLVVAARVTPTGKVSGRFGLAGGGADTTAGSRTITNVTTSSLGASVTGTGITASGKTVPFTLTVVDKPGGKDQVTITLGTNTVNGTLTTGDINTR